MGFFKKLGRAVNPISQTKQTIKNPVQGIKNQSAITLDPLGSAVRAGTGQQPAPTNLRSMVDPTGMVIAPQQQAGPTSTYTPGAMRLSPNAQAMYDQMKARTAARAAGQVYTPPAAAQPIPQMSAPLNAPKIQPITTRPIESAPAAIAPPARAQSYKGLSGVPMADGGKVRGEVRFDSKAFTRKPNGKPC